MNDKDDNEQQRKQQQQAENDSSSSSTPPLVNQEEDANARNRPPTQTLACNPFTRQEFYTTDLSVVYQVESATPFFLDSDTTTTSTTSDKNKDAAVTVLQALVQGAAVESIHDTLCGGGGAATGGGGGLDASSSSGSSSSSNTEQETSSSTEVLLSECLYSITAAETHEILYCHDDHDLDDTTTRSNYCIAFAGDIKLFHAAECAQENVQLAAWLALAQGTQQDAFLQSIRNGQQQWNSGTTTSTMAELNVTRVQVTENLYPSRSPPHGEDSTPNDNMAVVSTHPRKISPGGYVVIALAGVLLCILLGIVWIQHRQQQGRGDNNKKKNRSLEETSAATQNSYQTADFSNLALQHSRNDVHMCASNARCAICASLQPEDKVVQMIPVPKNQTPLYEQQQQQHQHDDSLAASYLDSCYSGDDVEDDDSDDDDDEDETYAGDEEEGVEAIAQPEVPVEIYSQKRRNHRLHNMFAKKSKPPAVALESVSFVRVASAQRATNKYHHHHRCEEMSCSVEL